MAIANLQIGSTNTTLLTASAETALLCVLFCNIDSAGHTISLYAYPSGGSAGDTTTIAKNVPIAAYDTWLFTGNEKLLFDTGGVLVAVCDSANKVTATISYKTL